MSPVTPIIDPFQKAVEGMSSLGKGTTLAISGLYGSSKAYFLAKAFSSIKKPILAILPDDKKAEEFSKDIGFFIGADNTLFYPSTELLPFETQSIHPDIAAARLEFLHHLLTRDKPFIAVAAAPTLLEYTMPKDAFRDKPLLLKTGAQLPREALLIKLNEIGYQRVNMVEERGEASIRGYIIDIFPPLEKYPLRLEFFGDEIESIRTFDPVTQRSQRELKESLILPVKQSNLSEKARMLAREKLLEMVEGLPREYWEPLYNRLREGVNIPEIDALLPLFYEKLSTIFDYLPENTIITILDPSGVEAEIERNSTELKERAEKSIIKPEELYIDNSAFNASLASYPVIFIEPLKSAAIEIKVESNMDIRQDIAVKKTLTPLTDRLSRWIDSGLSVYVTAHNKGQAARMKELLEGFPTTIINSKDLLEEKKSANQISIKIIEGSLSTGFRIPSPASLAIVTEEEIFGERVKRRPPPSKPIEAFLSQLRDLNEGGLVVHALHGIGVYRGLKRVCAEEVESEFLLIEYRDNDKLYVPVERLDLITKYHGIEGKIPLLDKLGGRGWEKKKNKVKKRVEEIAGELIKLYAQRTIVERTPFGAPGSLFAEFEEGFEYCETPDQLSAIEEVMKDMDANKPMDRIICGDVGYGKTEVAMRAAFRAVSDNKQSAVLVPTTVLAQQHYETFKKRFAPYPVRVEALSRFKSKKEENDILKGLRTGKIDIIISTHKLFGKNVSFKDLGLIVIDEEHRFGVRHKERLKEMKKTLDVLTLTATPIPRTLHMSLAGIRDLSVINTPPEDRLSITTRVIRFDDDLIKEAIEREIKRGGQTFFVHNRVETINAMRERLQAITSGITPQVNIAVAHGQMPERELEKVMFGFIEKKYQILLTTAIIESGLDIPSANTIIINRADRFGLAELYQLRGRVGRSSHRAYAYLITPDDDAMTADARKRLEVIKELSELGGGFRIAAYDLEIRGAGELLGKAQSGHIALVGFDMYTLLLEDTVSELRGEKIVHEAPPEVNLKVSRYLPEDYVPDTRERINIYKRLSASKTTAEVEGLKEEILDRYGRPDDVTENLFEVAKLKALLKTIGATELAEKSGRLYLTLDKSAGEKNPKVVERIMKLINQNAKTLRLTPEGKLVYTMSAKTSPISESKYLLKALIEG